MFAVVFCTLLPDPVFAEPARSKIEALPGKSISSPDRIHHPMRRLLVSNALDCIGIPYKWGGTTRRGFDCSGFVQHIYDISGIELPRTAQAQTSLTYTKGYLGPGDIVAFYPTNSPTRYHVGIYLGEGWFVHSPATGKKIRKERIDSPYFLKRFVGAWSPFTIESHALR